MFILKIKLNIMSAIYDFSKKKVIIHSFRVDTETDHGKITTHFKLGKNRELMNF